MSSEGKESLRETSGDFLDYIENWMGSLLPLTLESIVKEAKGPEHVALFAVDVINGFCHFGALASERVKGIVEPITRLFEMANSAGITNFVLMHDAHTPNAVEFDVYPPHCVRDTEESQIVPELLGLPFATKFHVLPKNSVHSAVGTGLNAWLEAHAEITHRIVVGDCTDLCTFHMATYLQFSSNAAERRAPVILPLNCVNTYDVPVSVAYKNGIPAHSGDMLHAIFLYNMACNGVRVVSSIDPPIR